MSQEQLAIWLDQPSGVPEAKYNLTFAWGQDGSPDQGRLHDAFEIVCERHALLTARYVAGSPELQAGAPVAATLEHQTGGDAEVLALLEEIGAASFGVDGLVRTNLIRGEQGWFWALTMHHIVSDAMTMQIVADEVERVYQGVTLPVSPPAYVEFVDQQQARLLSPEAEAQRGYWRRLPRIERVKLGAGVGRRVVRRRDFKVRPSGACGAWRVTPRRPCSAGSARP